MLLPLGTFIPASILMIEFGIAGVGNWDYTAKDLCDEFLSQGTVDIKDESVTTSLASLS
jgi:hypothetical protein